MPTPARQHIGLFLLVIAALATMTTATFFDQWLTQMLDRIHWPWLEEVMSRSLFEGEGLGANDPVLLILAAAIVVYYLACRKPVRQKWAAWRPQAGFTLVSAAVTGVYLVHALKWTMGRARPDLVLNNGLDYSHWFAFGPHFITQGIYYGSFPSGHTSQMFLLMTLAFVLAGDPLLARPAHLAGWLWGAVAVGASLLMGAARCMTLSHWATDVLGSILLGWIIMHLLYHYILRVPDQRRYIARHGRSPELPDAWEIVLCLYGLLGVAGLVMVLMGLRAALLQRGLWLLWMSPAGAATAWIAWKKASGLVQWVWRANGCNLHENGHPGR